MLVLDEVDRMLDMGFQPSMRRIVAALPKDPPDHVLFGHSGRQHLRNVVKRLRHQDPVRVEIGTDFQALRPCRPRAASSPSCRTRSSPSSTACSKRRTRAATSSSPAPSTARTASAAKLEKFGHKIDRSSTAIARNRSASAPSSAFRTANHRVLVATDVAARGIDVKDIAHVVNYDLPNASDDFVHRIGRTGRAGAKGVATTFVMPQERSDARKLERELKIKFDWREADKNLEKEERNKPVDLNNATSNGDLSGLLALETRSWKQGDDHSASAPSGNSARPGFRAGRPGGKGRSPAAGSGRGRSSAGSGAGRNSTHARGGNSGMRPTSGNRGR